MVLASQTVQVTSEANASPIMTTFTTMSAVRNIDHGDNSRGTCRLMGFAAGLSVSVASAAGDAACVCGAGAAWACAAGAAASVGAAAGAAVWACAAVWGTAGWFT